MKHKLVSNHIAKNEIMKNNKNNTDIAESVMEKTLTQERRGELRMEDVHLDGNLEFATFKYNLYMDDTLAFSIQVKNTLAKISQSCMIGWRQMLMIFHTDNRDITGLDAIESHLKCSNGYQFEDGELVKSCTFVTSVEHQAELHIRCVVSKGKTAYLISTLIVNGISISLKKEFAENICLTDMDLRFTFNEIKKYIEHDQNFPQIELLSK